MLNIKHTLFYVKINYKTWTKRNRVIILVAGFTEKTTNGWIYKWNIPGTTISIFEWDEDYEKGQHYHVMMPGMKNQHKEGNHYVPGTAIPEPWASMYF